MKNEALRKFIVSLKRKPQNIALVALVISFIVYSFNLTAISDTTSKIQGSGMGLCEFCIMLFSMLSFLCCMNAFPMRKPVNKPMLALLFVMFIIIFVCDFTYLARITAAMTRAESPILLADFPTAGTAQNVLRAHIVTQCITVVLVLTLPLYTKWLRGISTSVEVEDNGKMDAIDLAE